MKIQNKIEDLEIRITELENRIIEFESKKKSKKHTGLKLIKEPYSLTKVMGNGIICIILLPLLSLYILAVFIDFSRGKGR